MLLMTRNFRLLLGDLFLIGCAERFAEGRGGRMLSIPRNVRFLAGIIRVWTRHYPCNVGHVPE